MIGGLFSPPSHHLSKLEAGELTCLLVRAATELQIGAVLRDLHQSPQSGREDETSLHPDSCARRRSRQVALVVFIFTVDPPAPRVTVHDGLPFVVVEVNGETAGWSFVAVTRLLPVTPAFPKMMIGFGIFGEATFSKCVHPEERYGK